MKEQKEIEEKMKERKIEKEEKKKQKQNLPTSFEDNILTFRFNILCSKCKKIYKVRREVFDKRLQKYGTYENLVKNYVCRKCRKQ